MSQSLHKTYKARIASLETRVDSDAFEKSEHSFDRSRGSPATAIAASSTSDSVRVVMVPNYLNLMSSLKSTSMIFEVAPVSRAAWRFV